MTVREQENQSKVDSNERDAGIPFLCAFCRSEI